MMRRATSRFLGDLDAANDSSFAKHFVDSSDVERLVTPQSDVIYGFKGVGKTALRRALTELRREEYFFSAVTIDLDSLSFAQLYQALASLSEISTTELPTLARTIWRNAIALYALEAAKDGLPPGNRIRSQVEEFLKKEAFTGSTSQSRLISVIERIFRRVGQLGLQESYDHGGLPLALNIRRLDLASRFPITDEMTKLLGATADAVLGIGGGRPVLVCLDGFDSIVDHVPESRTAIFAGLIDAVFKCARDERMRRFVSIKAFLPEELTDEARARVWDGDKQLLHTHHLGWTEGEFKRFLVARLRQFSQAKDDGFNSLWAECMPETVKNTVHDIDEPSFAYILRHTLYRPRQLLVHLQRIFNQWDDAYDSFQVDATFISSVVARTNYDLAEAVANQLEVKQKGMCGFLQSWRGSSNTILMGDFQKRIKRVFKCDDGGAELQRLLTEMYNAGVYGTASINAAVKGARQLKAVFGFVGGRVRNMSTDDRNLVALSPMLHEYCECTASDYGVIVPVGA